VGVVAFAVATGPAGVAAATGEDHHPGGIAGGGVATVATGLDGPRAVADYEDGKLLVAESDSGEVSVVDPATGTAEALVTGLVNPQGVDYADGHIVVAVGESGPPEEGAAPPPGPLPVGQGGPGLLVFDTHGTQLFEVDTLANELANNPDGQPQFDPATGAPFDALSNPFAVLIQKERVLVADAGGNAVLSVDQHSGEISTFFVPPRIGPNEVAACGEEGAQANPDTVGCDPVPTGVTRGPDGLIYVSTLGAERPGAARVFVLTPDGKQVDRHDGFTGATGVAVDDAGHVYVSELFEGAPPPPPPGEEEAPPPPGFDPSSVGQVVRVEPDGDRSYAQVTMPTGLLIDHGTLYASAWSVAGFFEMPARGEVVTVGGDAFGPPVGG
jgi:YVTN family beta-propeller protein